MEVVFSLVSGGGGGVGWRGSLTFWNGDFLFFWPANMIFFYFLWSCNQITISISVKSQKGENVPGIWLTNNFFHCIVRNKTAWFKLHTPGEVFEASASYFFTSDYETQTKNSGSICVSLLIPSVCCLVLGTWPTVACFRVVLMPDHKQH